MDEEQAYNAEMYNEEFNLQKEATDEAQARLNRFNSNKCNYVFDLDINIELEELRNTCVGLEKQVRNTEEMIRETLKKQEKIKGSLSPSTKEQEDGEWSIER